MSPTGRPALEENDSIHTETHIVIDKGLDAFVENLFLGKQGAVASKLGYHQ